MIIGIIYDWKSIRIYYLNNEILFDPSIFLFSYNLPSSNICNSFEYWNSKSGSMSLTTYKSLEVARYEEEEGSLINHAAS
jgi:hypothetical protein